MIQYGTDYTDDRGEPVPADSWSPVDLGPYLRGEVKRAEPTIGLARADGLRLIYPGKEHAVIGEMEAGKGWFGYASAVAELTAGHHVLYAHFEESDPSDTVERLVALGASERDVLERFRFVGPYTRARVESLPLLLDPAPSLVVLDGVNEAMSLHGWGIRDEDGAAAFRRNLVAPCTAIGAAVLSEDHVVKDVERRGRNALGSIHKGNGLSGALIMLENAEPFGRGERGRSHVYVTKDRPGHLRRHGKATRIAGKTYMGELVVDDTQHWNPWLELKFFAPNSVDTDEDAPEPNAEADAAVLDAVRRIIGQGQEARLRTVRAACVGVGGLGKDKVDDALERLVLSGALSETRGARAARVFTVARDQLLERGE